MGRGSRGYAALYRYDPLQDKVIVLLALRSQREQGLPARGLRLATAPCFSGCSRTTGTARGVTPGNRPCGTRWAGGYWAPGSRLGNSSHSPLWNASRVGLRRFGRSSSCAAPPSARSRASPRSCFPSQAGGGPPGMLVVRLREGGRRRRRTGRYASRPLLGRILAGTAHHQGAPIRGSGDQR